MLRSLFFLKRLFRASHQDRTALKHDHLPYLEALKDRVLVFDGAMGTNLQAMALTADDFGDPQYGGCMDALVLTKPEAVEQVHRSFLEMGADAIETNTFR